MSKIMALTAKQIREWDELASDERAIEVTFKSAMNYHTNRHSELTKTRKKLWEDLGETFGFDPAVGYKLTSINGIYQVVEAEEDDE